MRVVQCTSATRDWFHVNGARSRARPCVLLVPQVPPALCELLPNLAALLERGRDAPQTFPLVEAYLLLGAAPRCVWGGVGGVGALLW